MTDQIAPPSSTAPLTAEDAAIIRAEKQLDEDTRGRLVQVYGESKTALGKRIALRRPTRQAWRCPNCSQMSDDIRRVCGNCLAPEPNPNAKSQSHVKGRVQLGPARSKGVDTHIRTIATTGRTYRQFDDPVGQPKSSAAAMTAADTTDAAAAAAAAGATDGKSLRERRVEEIRSMRETMQGGRKAGREDMYDDEPDCGNDDDAPCQPDGGAASSKGAALGGESDGIDNGSGGQERGVASPGAAVSDTALSLPPASTVNKEKHLPPERGSPFTHFLSLPIGKLPAASASAEAFVASLKQFVEDIATREADAKSGNEDGQSAANASTKEEGKQGGTHLTHLGPDLVTSAPKMHVTLLLLSLPTRKDVDFAKELLSVFAQRWRKEGAKDVGGFAVRFKGLHVMPERHGGGGGRRGKNAGKQGGGSVNPKKATVVYMGPRDEASTQRISRLQNMLHECFAELISEENREEVERTKVNLHMTVMNKKWRRRGAKRPFDATAVLEKFGDAVISDAGSEDESIVVPCVELNQMSGAGAKAKTYVVEASVPLS